MTEDNLDLVEFRTSCHWLFCPQEPGAVPLGWGGDRHKNEWLAGQTLLVPRAIAEARQEAGLGEIIVTS